MDCALSSVSSHLLGGEAYVPRKNEPTTQTAAQPSVMPSQPQTQPSTMYTQVPNYPSVMPSQPQVQSSMMPSVPDAEEQEALSQLLLAWYQAGYAAGRYASIRERKMWTVCSNNRALWYINYASSSEESSMNSRSPSCGLVDHLLHSLHLLFHLGHLRLQLLPLLLHLADFLR